MLGCLVDGERELGGKLQRILYVEVSRQPTETEVGDDPQEENEWMPFLSRGIRLGSKAVHGLHKGRVARIGGGLGCIKISRAILTLLRHFFAKCAPNFPFLCIGGQY